MRILSFSDGFTTDTTPTITQTISITDATITNATVTSLTTVGQTEDYYLTTNSSDLVISVPSQRSNRIDNIGITATVAASALTIALKTSTGSDPSSTEPVIVGFRHATLATGQFTTVKITSALSTVISSGSTAGQSSGTGYYIYIYLLNNSGAAELAWSRSVRDEGTVVTTTAEGGAGAADSSATIYSTTARTNVPCRLIGRLFNTQTTAGTWATAPSEISLAPFKFEKINCDYTHISQNVPHNTGTTILWGTKIIDNMNMMDTSTGIATIKEDGDYTITSHTLLSTATTWEVGEVHYLYIYINGSPYAIDYYEQDVTDGTSSGKANHISLNVRLVAGNTVQAVSFQNSDGDITLFGTDYFNRITIQGTSR